LSSLSSEQLAEFKQFGDRVSRDSSFMSAIANDSREAHEMAARLASTHARSERAEASLVERTAFAERISAAHEKGEAISIDIAQDPHNLEMFMRYAEQYGGDSAAAHTLMESELARQSLRPNRVFSDGTALPASFGDIRDQHVYQRGDAALACPISAACTYPTENRHHGLGTPSHRREPPPPFRPFETRFVPTGIKSAPVQNQAVRDFDAKAEIIKTDDGTLASKKSLLVQSGKQVGKDAGATLDNAKGCSEGLAAKVVSRVCQGRTYAYQGSASGGFMNGAWPPIAPVIREPIHPPASRVRPRKWILNHSKTLSAEALERIR
jgi:conjugal transfer mating pair stabilization protein TraG